MGEPKYQREEERREREAEAGEDGAAAAQDSAKRWDTDPTKSPSAPWDTWNEYANCWTCRSCGGAAGLGVHGPNCPEKIPSPDAIEASVDRKLLVAADAFRERVRAWARRVLDRSDDAAPTDDDQHTMGLLFAIEEEILRRQKVILGEPYWVLLWREEEGWGWLRSLDGREECTTENPARRLRYGSRDAALAAKYRFFRDNPKREKERLILVQVRAHGRTTRCEPRP